MKHQSLTKILSALAVLVLNTACNHSAFDAGMDKLVTDFAPSTSLSKISVSDPNLADGMTPATVTLTLRNAVNQPLPGVKMKLTVTGTENVIVPCTPSDANGLSRCIVYSTKAETKAITAIGKITLSDSTVFAPVAISRSGGVLVTGGDAQSSADGLVIASIGIPQDSALQQDGMGNAQLLTSTMGSLFGN